MTSEESASELIPPISMTAIDVIDEIRRDSVQRTTSVGGLEFVASRRTFRQGGDSSPEDPTGEWWRSFLRGETMKPKQENGVVTFIDLFASAGGLSLGFSEVARSLGFRPDSMFCADLDDRALDLYRRRFGTLFTHVGDVDQLVDVEGFAAQDVGSNLVQRALLEPKLKQLIGEVDVVLAGPPCQGHSSLNNSTRHEDPRNRLYLHPVVIGIALGAKAIIIENVPGVRRDTSAVVNTAEGLLSRYGYSVTGGVFKAEKLGWPQRRHRYFLIALSSGELSDLDSIGVVLGAPTRPISWALDDLLDVEGNGVLYSSPALSDENRQRIDWLFANDKDRLPDELRPACHRDKDHTYGSVYGRMAWNKPSGTITTGFSTPGRGKFIHPLRPRTLLPIEAARLQGFPDGYFAEIKGDRPFNRSELVKWIGDAVPPPLTYPAALCAFDGLLREGLLAL